jgi:hypothetical protein
MIAATVFRLLEAIPLTADPRSWYAGPGAVVMGLIFLAALYGFRVSLAGRPAVQEEPVAAGMPAAP